jgi:hypothetical protein
MSPQVEARYIEAYRRYGGDEKLIYGYEHIHPSVQRMMRNEKRIRVLLDDGEEDIPGPPRTGPAARTASATRTASGGVSQVEPSEPELLIEVLVMARKANKLGEYGTAIKAYEAYGRRKYGWRNETMSAQVEVTVNVDETRNKLIGMIMGAEQNGNRH